jgi:hypothetical protein
VLRLKVRLNPMDGSRTIYINRAPVLTLWAAVIALSDTQELCGFNFVFRLVDSLAMCAG